MSLNTASHVPADAGFLYVKVAVLGDTIKGDVLCLLVDGVALRVFILQFSF